MKHHCVFLIIFLLILGFAVISEQQNITKRKHHADYMVFPAMQSEIKMAQHILLEPDFWEVFVHEVIERKSWKCSFLPDVLQQNLDVDSKLYGNVTIFRHRRKIAELWRQNSTLWSITVLGACKELAHGTVGIFVHELQKFNVVEALRDYVEHLHYFYRIARTMEDRGVTVTINSQNMSPIHDIDKLDPVMIVGYSERFEDNKTTSLWNTCVSRHTHINPHHQAHCLWHDCCQVQNQEKCLNKGNTALNEMVCDKVSRRLQKNFNGVESDEMWDADISFYDGLPAEWLKKAISMMHDLKHWKKAD